VASNIKNNQEVIDDSINGILFDFNGNLESIINELNKDKNITEIISQNAVNKVIKNNGIENVCELEVNTMKKILF
jgi:glycosyltransferase involved in cell wall biosynthesis